MSYLLTLHDGPCTGSFTVQRAPILLRAVREPRTGKLDVLDLETDRPEGLEEVFAYNRRPGLGEGFACGRTAGSSYRIVGYRYLGRVDRDTYEVTVDEAAQLVPDDEVLRLAARTWLARDAEPRQTPDGQLQLDSTP